MRISRFCVKEKPTVSKEKVGKIENGGYSLFGRISVSPEIVNGETDALIPFFASGAAAVVTQVILMTGIKTGFSPVPSSAITSSPYSFL